MLSWIRSFFYSDDPVVRLGLTLSELDAQMAVDMLRENGIVASVRNLNFLNVANQWLPGPADYDLYVKQDDVAQALEVIGAKLGRKPSP